MINRPLLESFAALGDLVKLLPLMGRIGSGIGWTKRKARGSPDLSPAECRKLSPHLRRLAKRIDDVITMMEQRAKER